MDRNEVYKTVSEILSKSLLTTKKINESDRLVDDLALDSIGFVELGTGLEEKYQIDISDEVLESLKTVEMVIEAVLAAPSYAAA
ncbi:MAG TPA: acyl carrier protein [Cellvibrio sp.]